MRRAALAAPQRVTATDPTSEPSSPPVEQVDSPYRNLWVPLVIVPALIVVVLVVVFVVFGAVATEARGPRENLERMREGGPNERQQAAFAFAGQVVEQARARDEGRTPEFAIDASLIPDLEAAFASTPADLPEQRFVLAMALAQLEADGAIDRLIEVLGNPADSGVGGGDPSSAEAVMRFNLMTHLGPLGARLGEPQRERVLDALIPFLDGPDAGLRSAAAVALQRYPGERSRSALRGLLGSSDVELRGNAAIALSHLGDPSGADVLRELCAAELYASLNRAEPKKFAQGELVTRSRVLAVGGLARLGRAQDRELLEQLAAGEPDVEVREAAMRALAAGDAAR